MQFAEVAPFAPDSAESCAATEEAPARPPQSGRRVERLACDDRGRRRLREVTRQVVVADATASARKAKAPHTAAVGVARKLVREAEAK